MPAWYKKKVIPFWRIDILDGVHEAPLAKADEAADNSETPILPALPFTEGNSRWTLLYDHTRIGQIRPEKIRRMPISDLEYLASTAPIDGEIGFRKLEGNRARAQAELRRRDTIRASLIGAGVGAVVAAASGWLASLS